MLPHLVDVSLLKPVRICFKSFWTYLVGVLSSLLTYHLFIRLSPSNRRLPPIPKGAAAKSKQISILSFSVWHPINVLNMMFTAKRRGVSGFIQDHSSVRVKENRSDGMYIVQSIPSSLKDALSRQDSHQELSWASILSAVYMPSIHGKLEI